MVGVADEILGQAVKAFVVPKRRSQMSGNAVISYCRRNLEPFMVSKCIEFRVSLPGSPSGKIDKKALGAGNWVTSVHWVA